MHGIPVYDVGAFHRGCTDTQVISNAGTLYVYCPHHKVLANMQAVCPKFADWKEAREMGAVVNAKDAEVNTHAR